MLGKQKKASNWGETGIASPTKWLVGRTVRNSQGSGFNMTEFLGQRHSG